MNYFLALAAVFMTGSLLAGERKSILRQGYVVISDIASEDVPEGKCLVMGKVYSPEYDGDGQQRSLPGVRVATLDQQKTTVTDTAGKYKLLIDSDDTTLYMFAQQYEEIVIWNYLFRSKHIVTINFYPYTDYEMMNVDKPVIYLYSDQMLNARVQFASRGAVTFTYPEYNESWNVQVSSAGLKDTASGKSYPYLFWEAETSELDFKFDGAALEAFVIKTDTVVSFLESSLTAMGLNQTEQTDFITFWAPRMVAQPYALVQFLTGDDYAEKISTLQVTPKPDKLLRVFMLFSPLATDQFAMTITKPVFESFDRSGFTVVEWGGSQLPSLQIIP
ncbi:MAG: hypothetical protein HYZ14_12640 [Bacteroidetes bacterium]|nr:hypothetical protein [Bacteroidota bacterium]